MGFYVKTVCSWQPSWMEIVVTGHNFKSILPKDHPCDVCFKLADWFQWRRPLNNFPIGSYVKTMSAEGGHLEWRSGSPDTILKIDHFQTALVFVCIQIQNIKSIMSPDCFLIRNFNLFLVTFMIMFIFSSPGHRPRELLSWLGVRRPSVVVVRRPSVSFSHLNLLLWNHWTDLNQTCQKC
jgi:hypothetical protein